MVSKEELRKMRIFEDLPESMLEKIAAEAQLQIFSADTVLFRQNERLKYFYMILNGQVSLEVDLSTQSSITLGTVSPGYCFGVSSFIPRGTSSATAITRDVCELVCLTGERMSALFQEDGQLGYHVMLRVVRAFKFRMEQRTMLFLKTMEHHPELQSVFKDLDHLTPRF
jgi:thioredoxin reductase (NADPH)